MRRPRQVDRIDRIVFKNAVAKQKNDQRGMDWIGLN